MKTIEIIKDSVLIGATVHAKGDRVSLEDRRAALFVSCGAAAWPVSKPAPAVVTPADMNAIYEGASKTFDAMREAPKRGRKPSTADLRAKLEAAEKADLIPA